MFITGTLLMTGKFVSMAGGLLVASVLVVPAIVRPIPFIIEFVVGASAELLDVSGLQPTSANAAKMTITDRGLIDFIRLDFLVHVYLVFPNNAIISSWP